MTDRTNIDGFPRSGQSEPSDGGVAVYWLTSTGETKCIAIDRYDRVADNLAAVAATLDAMRAIERHGGATGAMCSTQQTRRAAIAGFAPCTTRTSPAATQMNFAASRRHGTTTRRRTDSHEQHRHLADHSACSVSRH